MSRIGFIIVAGMYFTLLAACTAQTQQRPAAVRSPDEIRARAMCEDMIADDVRRQAGEMMIESCVVLRLREIRAGLL